MKIQNYRMNGLDLYQKQVEKQQQTKQTAQKEDKVEISKEAKQLQKASGTEQERHEKIESIKKQIESGTYTIDPNEIAKSMIRFFRKQ
ncbi:flagellar biosynthesis anti-sigma factor FlgM [Bacillus sp. FJAT-47783]|uniref:flagellar biosynthesis anti-sigma factor FlgM n=1 Tax=Bacillus sp. FJAT-47783 TaxID=2922712 RepID=UPI001FABD82D|nr:flagellar biosynthesis anti-sigma factor FlgM [Bacillus sp. FJAT-47783]